MRLQAVKQALRDGKGNLRCKEVADLLAQLGFSVRDGKRGGHKVYTHDGLPDFLSSSFNCGHGRNPEIKPAYIQNIIRVIERHEVALRDYLGEEIDDDRS